MKTIAKLWSILEPREKAAAGGLVLLMIVSMVLEMVGLGLVVPGLTLMTGGTDTAIFRQLPESLAWIATAGRAFRASCAASMSTRTSWPPIAKPPSKKKS